MSTRQNDEKSIFKEALKLKTAAERNAYVDKACANDPALKARIFALLDAHEDKGDFLEALLDEPVVMLDDQELKEKPGTVIGRYKLLEKIGEGGMAIVYMAIQERPIRRKVALKIIKLGMDTKSVIARFEAERQALAIMDHPNIAKVFDAGATESGRPYFVMELVEGASITTYCDENRLNTKERLGLFIQVCNAVQHAHQKGIIHRDLKPSNVLITLQDGTPIPKVIDFGIAKATKQRLTEKTLFTRYAQMIGTPTYMSPEQAELSDLEIDIRTDIYSLGILLYELLTGTTPFSEEQLLQAGYLEMQRIICQEEPAKPSTKLTGLGEKLNDIAEHRGSTPDVLSKSVKGDLDWIVMKSIEKERTRRYETADAFADDIQRHIEDRPILARPPELMYSMQKFLRRYRLQVTALLMTTFLGIAIIFSLFIWSRYQHQLESYEPITHKERLDRAHKSFSERDLQAALKDTESILNSRHFGPEARLLYAKILIESQSSKDAVFILENLLNERPEIAGDARELLISIYLDIELSDAEMLRIAQKVSGITIYVDVNATGTNDGTSWADAHNSLQDALMAAVSRDEIKVAAGIYTPDQGAKVKPGDRKATFQLKQGVAVYGGIGGESILSGDLNGDDGPDFTNNSENSYHIVKGSDTNETTILDGFTITGANANRDKANTNGAGGGMYIHSGSPTISNCKFMGNYAIEGGGIYSENYSNPVISNCAFIENSTKKNGGGMQNRFSSPIVKNCSFIGNLTHISGAGMNNLGSNPKVINSTFEGNSAKINGGGMHNSNSNPTLTNCVFRSNSAGDNGGGTINWDNSNPTLVGCTFEGNSAGSKGGGLYNNNSSPIVTDCIFNGNRVNDAGGGMINWDDSNSMITNCTFIDNFSNQKAGGLGNNNCSPTVTNCVFRGNSAKEGGGMCNSRGSPTVTNCVFSMNSADQKGGGIAVFAIVEPNVTNMTNCTFSENSSAKGGAVAFWENSNSKLINCILWENTATKGSQLVLEENSVTLIKCCNLQGGSLGVNIDSNSSVTWDFGNVNSDPLFVNTVNADYHLQAGSPCVDSGDNTAIPPSVTEDIEEKPRIINGIVDMGAYEFNGHLSQRLRDGNPNPVDQAKIGSVSQVELLWEGTSEVNAYKVYFSTDPDNLILHGNVQKKDFMMLPVLKNNCQHFWRVDSFQSDSSVIPDKIWSFSTEEGLR